VSSPRPTEFECPVDIPIHILGGKWKPVLIFYLLQEPRRNGELRRLVPSITQKVLTQQLRELETDALITRTVFQQVPPKVVYDINPSERAHLDLLLQSLCDWGLYWSDKTGARIRALERLDGIRPDE
jgi:DNA-binding HxlR family transcriptional regulator